MPKVKFTPEQYAEAAAKFRGPLLAVPYLSLSAILQYMTPRLGVTGEEIVGESTVKAQLHPYRPDEIQKADVDIKLRILKTYFGTCNLNFIPNNVITTIIGHKASQAKGDGLKSTISAQMVLTNVAKYIGEDLGYAIWKGVRNPAGKTTMDLFDGFDEITRKEIESGNLSEENGNYLKVPAITKANAVDVFKQILYALHPVLRRTECFMYVAPELADLYNECFQMSHSGLIYNDKYEQVVVEGSSKKLIIVPMAEKAGSNYIQVCPKTNMLVGMDQMSDKESVNVGKYSSDTLTFEMRAFYGAQFESIDKRRMLVAEVGE